MPDQITLSKILIALTFVLWFAKSIFTKAPSLLSSPYRRVLYIAIILDIATSCFSLLKAAEPSSAISSFIGMSGVLALCLLLVNIVRDKNIFRKVIIAFFLGVSINALAGVYELITQEPAINIDKIIEVDLHRNKDELISESGGVRVQGLVGDPDYNAHLSILTIGIVLGSIFGQWFSRSRLGLFTLGFLATILMVNIFASSSRVGWMSFFVCVFAFILLVQFRHKWLLIASSFLLISMSFVGLGLFSNTPILSRLVDIGSSHSISLRVSVAKLCLSIFSSNPILGIGIGNFGIVSHRWYRNVPGYQEFEHVIAYGPSSGYLSILVEKGLLGFSTYILILLSFIAIMIRIMRRSPQRELRVMALGLLSSFLGHLVYLISIPIQYNELMWMVIGLGMALFLISEGETNKMPEREASSTWVGIVPYPQRNRK